MHYLRTFSLVWASPEERQWHTGTRCHGSLPRHLGASPCEGSFSRSDGCLNAPHRRPKEWTEGCLSRLSFGRKLGVRHALCRGGIGSAYGEYRSLNGRPDSPENASVRCPPRMRRKRRDNRLLNRAGISSGLCHERATQTPTLMAYWQSPKWLSETPRRPIGR